MLDIKNLADRDFYFNGHWLSEFDGYIGGVNGIEPLSLLPQKENKTEQILGKEAWLVTAVLYNPRPFLVPITFEKLGDNIRDIASWLNVLEPVDFYYENEDVKLKCLIDGEVDLSNLVMLDDAIFCTTEIKFIAYDPFYYSINYIKYVFTNGTYTRTSDDINCNLITKNVVNFDNIRLFNNGNCKSYPLIKINGTGDITFTINSNVYTLTNIIDYIYIDSNTLDIYKDPQNKDTTNEINKLTSGDFSKLILNAGYNTISFTGTIISVEIICNSRWI